MSNGKTDEELLKRAQELQKEARRIVDQLGIFSILKKISEPFFAGSVKNGLMAGRDIDIESYMEKIDIDKIVNLLKEFALLPTVQKVQFNNFLDLRRDYPKNRTRFPYGYYIGLRSIQPSGEWKMDIWFGEKGKPLGDYKTPDPSEITEEQKIAILRIKDLWLAKEGGYKDMVIAVDIYKAVLEHGVTNEDEFKNYLKKIKI